jgi:hypothetical protein
MDRVICAGAYSCQLSGELASLRYKEENIEWEAPQADQFFWQLEAKETLIKWAFYKR